MFSLGFLFYFDAWTADSGFTPAEKLLMMMTDHYCLFTKPPPTPPSTGFLADLRGWFCKMFLEVHFAFFFQGCRM